MQTPLVEAWGDFLSNYRWSWFVTLTFREETKSFAGIRKFNAIIRALEKATGRSVPYFRADQYGDINGRFHFHALIANVEDLRRLTWMDWWNEFNGYALIEPFDPTLGAPWYCSRYMMKPNAEYDLGGDLASIQIFQPVLPMEGLRVQTDTRKNSGTPQQPTRSETAAARVIKRRENRIAKRGQGAIADFREPSMGECGPNPIIAHFNGETRRKRR
jgi:hypothetical protein